MVPAAGGSGSNALPPLAGRQSAHVRGARANLAGGGAVARARRSSPRAGGGDGNALRSGGMETLGSRESARDAAQGFGQLTMPDLSGP